MRSKAQILIVDDQEGIRSFLLETCQILGYSAEATACGREALELIANRNYQLAFVDLKMPGLDGQKTIQEIVEKRKNIKVIVITGYSDSDKKYAELLSSPQVLAILKKPFTLEELQTILEKNISE